MDKCSKTPPGILPFVFRCMRNIIGYSRIGSFRESINSPSLSVTAFRESAVGKFGLPTFIYFFFLVGFWFIILRRSKKTNFLSFFFFFFKFSPQPPDVAWNPTATKQQPKGMMGCLKGVLLLLCFMQMYNGCDRKTRLFNNSLSRIIPTADVNVLLKGVLAGVCVFRGKKKKSC